jgi:hypothetical protein
MNRQTIDAPVRGKTFTIAPGQPGSGLVINSIPLHHSRIIHAEHRVDIREGHNVAFIIEHPVAVATIFGIHDAAITGNREAWDFYRAADREAHARGLDPPTVLGPADGSIGADVAGQLERSTTIDQQVPLAVHGVKERVEFAVDDGNSISILPPQPGKLVLDVSVSMFNLGPFQATLDPVKGLLDGTGAGEVRFQVLRARSAAVVGLKDEALLHALGDVVADIAGMGGIRAGKVDARLSMKYHQATVGAVKLAIDRGLIVPVK